MCAEEQLAFTIPLSGKYIPISKSKSKVFNDQNLYMSSKKLLGI